MCRNNLFVIINLFQHLITVSKTNVLARAICLAIILISTQQLLAQKKQFRQIISRPINTIAGEPIEVKGTKWPRKPYRRYFLIHTPADKAFFYWFRCGIWKQQFRLPGNGYGDIVLVSSPVSLNEIVVTAIATHGKKTLPRGSRSRPAGCQEGNPVPDVVNMLHGQARVSGLGFGPSRAGSRNTHQGVQLFERAFMPPVRSRGAHVIVAPNELDPLMCITGPGRWPEPSTEPPKTVPAACFDHVGTGCFLASCRSTTATGR